jgi:hypothetical protein
MTVGILPFFMCMLTACRKRNVDASSKWWRMLDSLEMHVLCLSRVTGCFYVFYARGFIFRSRGPWQTVSWTQARMAKHNCLPGPYAAASREEHISKMQGLRMDCGVDKHTRTKPPTRFSMCPNHYSCVRRLRLHLPHGRSSGCQRLLCPIGGDKPGSPESRVSLP